MRIAMWSGPRNLSTAMMYSFGARSDCAVWDEPFYAPWLATTGVQHPLRDQVLAAHESDPAEVASACAKDPDNGHIYQKHMPHHMCDAFDRSFMQGAANVFLLRHPQRVVASYAAKLEQPTLEELAPPQFLDIWEEARALGPVTVIDSFDIRRAPKPALQALCAAIDLPWDAGMLQWPAGGRPEDGVWAAHWYAAVHRSTGFAGPEGPLPRVSDQHVPLLQAAMRAYDTLRAEALRIP